MKDIQLIWTCDSSLQFEKEWILGFLGSRIASQISVSIESSKFEFSPFLLPVIVESGLIRLRRDVSESELAQHDKLRISRYSLIPPNQPFCVIHLSDEEGFDADSFYTTLASSKCVIWRNFYHERHRSFGLNLHTFPIGPRSVFIPLPSFDILPSAENRIYPWSFMGTIWSSGSRFEAVSRFLVSQPQGYHLASRGFGSGLPLETYKQVLCSSIFSLAPEGDRHLDTFRLWESLSCGCIPLVVDYQKTASKLLPPDLLFLFLKIGLLLLYLSPNICKNPRIY